MKLIKQLFLLFPLFGFSQELITSASNRVITSLNGEWNFIVDSYETVYYSFHSDAYEQQKEVQNAANYSNYHAQNKQELVEYDFNKSPTVTIPGDWNSQKENLFYYEGTIWFKKSFDFDLKVNKRLFVYFGAINYKAEVYLNGKKLGVHEGGFTPFNFEVSSIIKTKDNFLVVKVDNVHRKEAVPTLNTDWFNY